MALIVTTEHPFEVQPVTNRTHRPSWRALRIEPPDVTHVIDERVATAKDVPDD